MSRAEIETLEHRIRELLERIRARCDAETFHLVLELEELMNHRASALQETDDDR